MFGEQKTSGALIGLMRGSNWTMRSIASVVILTFGGLVTAPAVAAVKQEIQQIQWHKDDGGNAAKLSAKVEETHAFLSKLAAHDAKSLDLAASHEQLHALKADLESLDKGTMDDFAANEAHIKAHKLPAVIEQRQQEAVKTYRSNMDTLMAELNAADSAKDATGFMAHVTKAKAHLDKVQVKPFHAKFDPKNLPFSVAKPTGVKPRLTKKDYQARPVAPAKRAQVATNGSLVGILSAADVTGALPANPGDPSYVAATDDVQITPAIQAQATTLHNDPVQIYNWVHNNIEYIPSYDSIQGSDMTLQTLKGNDFDQASLLIALLRASNIPSRYVYGTVQVPIAQVENWVGGVTDPNAAMNLMAQGGIPVNAVVQGGQIKYAQFEHVWVEAWVNFIPSRAAKVGPGNTWVPLDASFKQYTYTQGINLRQAMPFDVNAAVQHITSTSTFNSDMTSVSNVDLAFFQQQLSNLQQQAGTYVNSLNSSTTVQQVVGSKTAIQTHPTSLGVGLPYVVTTIGERYTSLPDQLHDKFQFELEDQMGNVIFDYTADTADLAGKLFALSFSPASANDAQLLESYIPVPNADGSSINLSEFPASLPGYLINLVPHLTLGGQAVATGSAFTMGTQLQTSKGYWTSSNGWVESVKPLTVGQYQAIGLDLIGDLQPQLYNLYSEMTATQNALQSGNLANINSYTLVESKLQANVLGYFSLNDLEDVFTSRSVGAVSYRAPSYGTFSMTVQANLNFGVPISTTSPGYLMDIDHAENYLVSSNNDAATAKIYNLATGVRLSLLENNVPQQMLSTTDYPVAGVSAASALYQAESAGQTIYIVNATNSAAVLPLLSHSSDVIQRIQDVVSAGDQVTISQADVTLAGWTGAGYFIQDPVTGTGAYEIAGGADGANISDKPFTLADTLFTLVDNYTDSPDAKTLPIPDELEVFGKGLPWIEGTINATELLGSCGVTASITFAVINTIVSNLLTDFMVALLPVTLGLGTFFLMLFYQVIIGWIMNLVTELEAFLCRSVPPP